MVITKIMVKSRSSQLNSHVKSMSNTLNKEEHYHEKYHWSLVLIMIGCDNIMASYSMLLSWTLLTSASPLRDSNQQQIIDRRQKLKGRDKTNKDSIPTIIH